MLTRAQYTESPYAGEADLAPMVELIDACDAVDRLDDNHTVDTFRVWVDMPGRDKPRDIRLWRDEPGSVVALAMLYFPKDDHAVSAYSYWHVHPELRGSGLDDTVLEWCETRMREVSQERGLPATLRAGARDTDTYRMEILEKHGYSVARYFIVMRRSLSDPIPEPQFPEGFTLSHVKSEEDAPAWVEMFNLSFIDHYDFHEATVERRLHRMRAPNYRADGDLIALAPDGTFAAFCLCDIDPEHNERNNKNEGWIAVLGTRRGYRKIGLGRAMLLSGLHKLKADGVDTAVLDVDAENPTGALGLYESAGFYRDTTEVLYSKVVA